MIKQNKINYNYNNKNNKNKLNKKGIAVQTIFYIFMSIIMIAIIVFGLKQMYSVSEQLSETERVEIQKELKQKIESCEDPLNKGNVEYIQLENQKFNSICFLGEDLSQIEGTVNNFEELEAIANTGDNVVLLKAEITSSPTIENQIITTMKIDSEMKISYCEFPKENTNDFYFELKCE